MGRRAKPAEVAQAQGNPGHRKLAVTPAAVPKLGVEAPHWLAKDARTIWAELVTVLGPLNFVKQTDVVAVARYADHLARYIRLSAEVSKKGGIAYETSTPHGTMQRLHPNFAALVRTESMLVTLEDRIGMSPAARQSLMTRAAAGLGMSPPPEGGHGTAEQRAAANEVGPFGALALDLDAEDADETGLPQ
jgi:P27 family predicted phage terminase small subunit